MNPYDGNDQSCLSHAHVYPNDYYGKYQYTNFISHKQNSYT